MKSLILVSITVSLLLAGCSSENVESETNKPAMESLSSDDAFVDIVKISSVDTAKCVSFFDCSRTNKSALSVEVPDPYFHKCGSTCINGSELRTVIIGSQRWTVVNYNQTYDANGVNWSDDTENKRYLLRKKYGKKFVNYYPYDFAMTFTDYEAEYDEDLPDGFEATSGWRIPSDSDRVVLWYYAVAAIKGYSKDIADYIVENLELSQTDLYVVNDEYIPGTGTPETGWVNKTEQKIDLIYEGFGLFWNSDKIAQTYCFTGMGTDATRFCSAQSNREVICAPIRFVQDVKPLTFE